MPTKSILVIISCFDLTNMSVCVCMGIVKKVYEMSILCCLNVMVLQLFTEYMLIANIVYWNYISTTILREHSLVRRGSTYLKGGLGAV